MVKKILAVVQARIGSTRLPGKVLAKIQGVSLLEHILQRVSRSIKIDNIIVATSDKKEEKPIIDLCKKLNVNIYQGSSKNVLSRFYEASKKYGGDVIVRITADDPFKDPKIIDKIIRHYFSDSSFDYVSNTIKPTFPLGMDVEVFSFKALEIAYKNATSEYDKEHVTPYIYNGNNNFKISNFRHEKQLSHLRWTIDKKNDLLMAREVYRKLYNQNKIFYMEDILQLLETYPNIANINSNYNT